MHWRNYIQNLYDIISYFIFSDTSLTARKTRVKVIVSVSKYEIRLQNKLKNILLNGKEYLFIEYLIKDYHYIYIRESQTSASWKYICINYKEKLFLWI